MILGSFVNSVSSSSSTPELREVSEASGETAMVLAACHSLVVVQEDGPKTPNSTTSGKNG